MTDITMDEPSFFLDSEDPRWAGTAHYDNDVFEYEPIGNYSNIRVVLPRLRLHRCNLRVYSASCAPAESLRNGSTKPTKRGHFARCL